MVVIATGWADFPYLPTWPGSDAYTGSVIHSTGYNNPAAYTGKRVLVVGFGNSGGEIALDLAQANVDVTLAVRGPIQILPGSCCVVASMARKSLSSSSRRSRHALSPT